MRKVENNIVGLGEVTGHFHNLTGEDVAVYDPEDGSNTLLIDGKNGFDIHHQEHKTFSVPPSQTMWERRIVNEYDPIQEAVKSVAD